MKKFLKIVLIIIALVVCSFSLNKYLKDGHINATVFQKDLKFNGIYKGLKGAVDFTRDNEGNYYIAYKEKVQKIENNGKSYNLFKNKDLDIKSIDIDEENLYYSSKNSVYSYNLKNKVNKCLVSNIPNFGDYKDTIIRKHKNYLYITIGSATNSGVVGPDNSWVKDRSYNCDVPPKTLIIKGLNFGEEKTGAFVPYGTSNVKGQMIPGHVPGNASVIIYNSKTGALENFAWGIRNIKGMDFNNEEKLIAIVGGMEDRGLRPVKGDVDYIYEIKKGIWYGWPDYTGGDPINGPKFKGKNEERISFILDKHPCTNPPAPLYQYKNLDSLVSLCVDRQGVLGEKDNIYFYDKKDNKIYAINKRGILRGKLELGSEYKITSLKFMPSGMEMLDGEKGMLYQLIKTKKGINTINERKLTLNYLIILCLLIFGVIIYLKVKKIFHKRR